MNGIKLKILAVIVFFICFFYNFFLQNGLNYSFLNTLLLLVSLLFIYNISELASKVSSLYILTIPLIPLFRYVPSSNTTYLIIILYLLFFWIAFKFNKYKKLFILLGFSFLVHGAFISNKLSLPLGKADSESFIWNNPVTNYWIDNFQRSSFYTFYKMRLIIYNNLIYIYAAVTSIAKLINLKNLYDTLLLANIYPLVLGIIKSLKNRNDLINKIVLMSVFIALFIAGISRFSDKFASLFIITPFLIYLILEGFTKVNKKIYLVLFLLSLILLTSPV